MDRKMRDVVYHNHQHEKEDNDDESNETELVLSNKGGPKIIHKNFMYTLHKKHPFNIRWRCVARSYYCRGSLITTVDCKKPRVHMEHNHEPDYIAVKASRRRYMDLGKPPIIELQQYSAEQQQQQQENQQEPVEFSNFQEDLLEVQEEKIDVNPMPGGSVEGKKVACLTMKQEPEEDDDILEEGLQPPSPSALGHRVRSHSRSLRAMANPSAVWAHFDLCTNDPLRAQCRICGAVVVRGGANPRQCGTTNLHRHLRVHHGGRLIGRRYHVLQSQQREKSSFSTKSIRVPTQSYSKQMKNVAPTNLTPSSTNQQGQQQPKTLVLKTIPLKVKQVAPTTIKMPPRQASQGVPQTTVPQQAAEVCLRWNSYHSNMQNSFPSLLDTEQFVDVTLACEGRSLKCHKMILSTCSDYLAELLRENPCQHPIILMKDLKFWEVEALVKFMYRGEVNVAHEKLPQLLNAAEALQIKGLAGPSSQNSRPPLLLPPTKSQQSITRLPETKENRPSTSSGTITPSSPKRAQKRQITDTMDASRGFTKIRLQRPQTPESPNATVKLEPLDIPLSPGAMFSDNNLMGLHEEEDPGGSIQDNEDRDMNFGTIDGPPDLTDGDDQMEFVPTDFLDQEHDIVEDVEPESCLSERDESRKSENSEDCDYQIDDKVNFDKRDKFEESNKPITEKLLTIIKKDKV